MTERGSKGEGSLAQRAVRTTVFGVAAAAIGIGANQWYAAQFGQPDDAPLEFVHCGPDSKVDTFERANGHTFKVTGFVGERGCTDVFDSLTNKSRGALEIGDTEAFCNNPGSDRAVYNIRATVTGYVVLSERAQQLASELKMDDCIIDTPLVGNRVEPTPSAIK